MSEASGPDADGAVDYSSYSEPQLFRALRWINAEKYPLNFTNLKAAFAARQIPIDDSLNATDALMAAERIVFSRPQPPWEPGFRIAFAPSPGVLTWLGPSRNDFRLVGKGSIVVKGETAVLEGRRFGFLLGLPLRRRFELKLAHIFNVELEENVVRFEYRAENGKTKAVTFWLADAMAAETLTKLLPPDRSPDFVPQLPAYLDFEEHLEKRAPHLPVTYGLAGLCLVMFVIMLFHGAQWFNESGIAEISWGSNFGPSTIGGQWWRLLTYSLLHFGVLHLAFNLWALISFGTIAERLYGSGRYAIICVVAGVVGGMASIVIRPLINSAGASAMIFGVFGALLVADLRGAEAIPPSVKRSLRNSTLFFMLVTFASGLLVSGIDNAAHFGGFVAGIGVGLAFQSPWRAVRIAAPAMLAVLVIVTGARLARRALATPSSEAAYWDNMRWFLGGELNAVKHWMEVQELARAQKIGDEEFADRLDHEVLPFWREASERFKPVKLEPGTKLAEALRFMQTVSNGRLHAIELCASGSRKHDAAIIQACLKEMQAVDVMIGEQQKLQDGK